MIKSIFTFFTALIICAYATISYANIEEHKNSYYIVYKHNKVLYKDVVNVQYDSATKEYMFLVYDSEHKIHAYVFENEEGIQVFNIKPIFWRK